MTFRSLRFSLSAGALLFALASEAAAVELGGRFEGKLSCTGLDAEGNSVKQSLRDSELLVAQDEADLVVSIDELIYTGVLVEALGDEEREGAAVVAACNGDGDPQGRLESFLIEAKGTPGSVKASLKLRSVNGTGGALECSGSYKRVDAKEVPLDECPVFYSCVCVGVNDGEDACGNGGAGGNNGDVHADRTEAQRVGLYETGADTGWVCVAQ